MEAVKEPIRFKVEKKKKVSDSNCKIYLMIFVKR